MKQSAVALLAALVCSASSLLPGADATIYNITWKTNPTTSSFDAKAGDTLIFNFPAGAHNVWQFPSETDMTNCNFANGKLLSATAPYNFAVTAADPKLYFGCKVGTHCATGKQKLTVNVGAASGGSSPSSAPTTSSGSSSSPTTASSSSSSSTKTVAWKVALESKSISASAGDQITFQFTTGHDLYSFTSATDLQACNFNTATKLAASGPHTFTVPSSGASAYYFSCSVTGHCTKGQQLTVTVGGSSSDSGTTTGSGNSTSDSTTGGATPTTASSAIRSADQVAGAGLLVALTAAVFQQLAN